MSSIAVETLQDKKIVDPAKPQFTRYIKVVSNYYWVARSLISSFVVSENLSGWC